MKPMNARQYRAAIKQLGFAQSDRPHDVGVSAASRFFEVGEVTGRRWAMEDHGPPAPVVVCLRLMLAAGISADKARKLLEG